MRRIYMTEAQLKGIMGEDFEAYLPNEAEAAEDAENSTGYEIATSDKNEEGELTDTVITDKIGNERFPMNYFRIGYRGYGTGVNCLSEEDEMLSEMNQDFADKRFRLGRNNKQAVQAMAAQNGGDKLLNNMSKEASFNVNTLYKRRKTLSDMKKNDPKRFASINGQKLLNDINNQLETAKKSSANMKKGKAATGAQNVYQKAGGTKQSGNGAAHTKKNGTTVTYFN